MKTMRNLFLLCAGLSLFACSSDDEVTNQLPEGKAAITIKVGLPGSRAIDTTPNSSEVGDNKVELSGTVYVELTTSSGSAGVKEVGNDGTVTFYGISEPTSVEAWVNGGKTVATTQNLSITAVKTDGDDKTNYNMQADAENVPAYGITNITSSNLTTKTETYDGVNYRMYEASVEMSIPVARIEFAVTTTASTKFSALNLAGVYLDMVIPTSANNAQTTNYHHKNDVDIVEDETVTYKTTATGENAILYDYESIPSLSVVSGTTLPAESQVYAYNVYPGSAPYIKLWFNNATAASGTDYVVPYQYAVVNSYNSGTLTEFEEGKIYRITGLVLNDSNLSTDESGTDADINYGIDVTVTEAMWDVVDVTGSWTK